MEEQKENCKDKKCPLHSNIRIRGRKFKGVVIAKDLHRSATIEFKRVIHDKKYERYYTATTRMRVHNPSCINAEIGDKVTASECRPLSKSKKCVIIQKIGKDVLFQEKMERKKESMKRIEKKSEDKTRIEEIKKYPEKEDKKETE